MNHSAIIGRAWSITWRHRVLWLFGALAGAGGLAGSGAGQGSSVGGEGQSGELPLPDGDGLGATFMRDLVGQVEQLSGSVQSDEVSLALLAGVVILALMLLAFILVAVVLSYVGRVGLVRLIDDLVREEISPRISTGLGYGFSGRSLRLFGLELIVFLSMAFLLVLIAVLTLVPIWLIMTSGSGPTDHGIWVLIALGATALLFLIAIGAVVGILAQLWTIEVAAAGEDIGASLSNAWRLLRSRPLDLGLIWAILLVIGLIAAIPLIIATIMLLLVAGLVSVSIGAALYSLGLTPLAVLAISLPPAFLIMVLPLAILSGLLTAFNSSAWYLTWREVSGRDLPAAASPPAAPSLQPDPGPAA